MKRVIIKICLLVFIVVTMLIGYTDTVMAVEEYDCPASIGSRGTTQYASANGVFDSTTNTTTYTISTANKPGAEIIELCIYPNPDIGVSDSDLTPVYDNWRRDNPGNKPGFGFLGVGNGVTRMPLDGATNTVGMVRYADGPSPSETLLLHVSDVGQCGPGGTCWMFPSTGEPVPPIPPIANPNGPYMGTEGIAVTFDGSASSDPDDNIVSYSWNFGDGNTGTGINPLHIYSQNGEYTVSLTVTDNSGLTNTNTTTVTIIDTDPIIAFTGIPLTGIAPLTVTFTDSSTSYDGITSWKWDFENDGTIDSTLQNPAYIYTSAGTYTAKLTVCESDGDCASSTITVTATSGGGGGDTQIPTQPLCPVAISTGPTTIYFSWWASTDNVGVAGYKIYRSTDNINFYQITTVTNTFYTDTGLATGTTYYYAVQAFDTSGNPSLQSDVVYATPRDIESPIVTIPSNIITEATSPVGAVVNFYASAMDDIDGSITPICNPSSGSTFRLGLTTVTCTATDSAGNIGSTVFSITVVDTTSPTPPSGLTAIAISTSRIDLSWTASYDAVGVTQYLIYRSVDNINFVSIGSTPGTTFQNTGLMADTTYYYYVVALDAAGHRSNPSSTTNARTFTPGTPPIPSPIPPPPEGQTPPPSEGGDGTVGDIPPTLTVPANIIAEATSSSGAVVTYSITVNDPEDGDLTSSVTCSPVSGSMFSINTTVVTCWVTDSGGNTISGMFTVTVRDTTPPTAPSGLTATAVSTTGIDLSWTLSTDIVGVTEYKIYRSLNNINFATISTTTGTTFSNTGLIPNTTYYYYVIALDDAGNPSNPSNTADARTFVQPPSPPPTPGPSPSPSPSPTETGGPEPSPTITINPCEPTENTQQGQAIQVVPTSNVNVQFDAVLQCGDTTAIAYYDNQWTSLPNNYKSTIFYDIDTTSTYVNYITINIVYPNPPSNVNENSLRMFHYDGGNWVDVTTALDTVSNTITGRVTSLSPFGIGGASSGGSGSGSGITMRGPGFDGIGLIILSICLITISILGLKKKNNFYRK